MLLLLLLVVLVHSWKHPSVAKGMNTAGARLFGGVLLPARMRACCGGCCVCLLQHMGLGVDVAACRLVSVWRFGKACGPCLDGRALCRACSCGDACVMIVDMGCTVHYACVFDAFANMGGWVCIPVIMQSTTCIHVHNDVVSGCVPGFVHSVETLLSCHY